LVVNLEGTWRRFLGAGVREAESYKEQFDKKENEQG